MNYFTVLSLNTWKCEGDYPARLDSMVTEITLIEPDVILLQEVFASCNGEWDTAAYLAGRLSLNYIFHPARRKKRFVLGKHLESESGLAILAKREIIEHGAIELPTTLKDPSRWLQFAKLGFESKNIVIMNTHLTHLNDDKRTRFKQSLKILEVIEAVSAGSPLILGGDFNADLDDPIIGLLADKKKTPLSRLAMNLSTLRDHDRCIDHIFITDLFQPVSSNRVLDGSQSSGYAPSDHYGVLAKLKFLK